MWGGAATRRDLKSDFIHIELNTLYLYSNTWFHVCFYMKVSVSLQSVCGYARWRNFRGSASVEHGRDLNHPQSTQSEGTLWPMSTTFQVGIAQFAKIYWHSLLVNRVAIGAVGGARDFSNWGKIRAIKLFCGQYRSRQGLGGQISRRWACPLSRGCCSILTKKKKKMVFL